MISDLAGDASLALGLTERIAAAGALLGSLELLSRRGVLRDDGMLSWKVARLRSATLAAGPSAQVLDRLFAPSGVYVVVWVRAISAAFVVAAPSGSAPSVGALVVAALTSLLLMLRTPYGNDGADQMLLIVLVSSGAVRVIGSEQALVYALWFVALQCCLAYLTSGFAKLAGRSWRDGSGLTGVLYTRVYGMRRLAALLARRRWLAVVLSWTVIFTELAFVFVLIAPSAAVPYILAGGLAFHLGAAVVMGLNAFVWGFGAAYPAIVYAAV